MQSATQRRVLVVCGGNTCRSPVLAFLLMRKLHRIGCSNVEVFSAGASERLSEDPRYAGGLNCFAFKALTRSLDPPQDAQFEEVVQLADAHRSRGLSRFRGQRFDLLVFVDPRHKRKAVKQRIVASQTYMVWPRISDRAFAVWDKADRPTTITDDPTSRRILKAYERQTALLRRQAEYLSSKLASRNQG